MLNEPKVNILLVDDHPENLVALEAILSRLGQNLVQARSGVEALKCLLNQDFAVILLDVQMPGMDGFETASLIRERQRSRSTPIIFLTAFNTSDAFVVKGYSLKAVDYLFKPIDADILTSKVEVFVELYQTTAALKQQTAQLVATNVQLKRSEEQFRSLSACSPIGIFLTDIAGRCTYTNPRCQAICGFSLEESLGEGWTNFIHPDDRQQVLEKWENPQERERGYVIEYRCQSSSSPARWVSLRSAPMFSDLGQLMGHVGTVEDISDRKQAEETQFQLIREQIARQEAEAINRMKDEFLAVLSHELRTPLNSILGWAKLLRSRQLDAEKTARALESIERNAQLQTDLIADILDVSRIIQGKLQIDRVALCLLPIVEAGLDAVSPLAIAKSIHLESSLDAVIEPVLADANRVQQMVGNLLSNAIKFTPAGGRVELHLSQVGDFAQIQVKDTGIGIPAHFLPYIFDRFRQADSSTTRGQGGLGLGLAIVQHLVNLHHGTITVESPGEGQGATFTIQLPTLQACQSAEWGVEQGVDRLSTDRLSADRLNADAASESDDCSLSNHLPPSATAQPVAQIHPLKGLYVLVVEDDPDAKDFIQFLLEESGAEVTAVASAQAALDSLAQRLPHVLVSDIGMAEEDGYSLMRQIRSLTADAQEIPAIALTAYVGESDRQQAFAAGFQVHLAKPVKPKDLLQAIANLAVAKCVEQ